MPKWASKGYIRLSPVLNFVQSKYSESHPWLMGVNLNGPSWGWLGCDEEEKEDQLSNLKCAPLQDQSGEVWVSKSGPAWRLLSLSNSHHTM